jgi:hypothetical protein
MPRSPNNPDRDFSVNLSNENIDADIEENLVIGYGQLIDDSQVRFRIGEIITQAMSQPTRVPRR